MSIRPLMVGAGVWSLAMAESLRILARRTAGSVMSIARFAGSWRPAVAEKLPRKQLQLYRPEDVEREAMVNALIVSGFRLRMVLARERAKWRYAEIAVNALLNRTRVQSQSRPTIRLRHD